ncbi:MAG: AraC family transcriptional regulator [Verrucomicrobiaceae bacterium]|nr:MAG: AraC family transcriptional regulator [Verrucomicrobiaceae bacterium]
MSGKLVQSPFNPDWLIPEGWEQILGLQLDYRLGSSVLHLLRVQFHQHAGEGSTVPHIHPCHQLLYYQRGAGTLEVDGQKHPIRRGSAFFVPAERSHQFTDESNGPTVCLAMDFTIDAARTAGAEGPPVQSEAAVLLSLLYAQPARPFHLPGKDQTAIDRCIEEIIEENESREVGFASLIQSHLLRLIALCLRGTQRAQGFEEHFRHTAWRHRLIAERALSLIGGNATRQPELTLSEVARHCAASPNHLNRILRQQVGQTFHQILLQQRLERARTLLREGRLNCTEAALHVGFNDSNYFSRAFRKLYGHAPSELLRTASDC